jgi:hypothetical protein
VVEGEGREARRGWGLVRRSQHRKHVPGVLQSVHPEPVACSSQLQHRRERPSEDAARGVLLSGKERPGCKGCLL